MPEENQNQNQWVKDNIESVIGSINAGDFSKAQKTIDLINAQAKHSTYNFQQSLFSRFRILEDYHNLVVTLGKFLSTQGAVINYEDFSAKAYSKILELFQEHNISPEVEEFGSLLDLLQKERELSIADLTLERSRELKDYWNELSTNLSRITSESSPTEVESAFSQCYQTIIKSL